MCGQTFEAVTFRANVPALHLCEGFMLPAKSHAANVAAVVPALLGHDSLMKSEEDNNGQDSSLLLRLITG